MVETRRKTAICFAAIAAICFAALSCSRTQPKIAFAHIELVYYQEAGGPQERFSLFIIPEDDEGTENLADLFLYNDLEQLRWHVGNEEWVSYESDGRTWIGTRSIVAPVGETLPRGQYRVVLVNKGGEKSERNITFDAPSQPRFAFPTIAVENENYTVVSSYPVNRIITYDGQGNFLTTVELSSLSGALSTLNFPNNTSMVALWADDPERLTSAYTDVVPIR